MFCFIISCTLKIIMHLIEAENFSDIAFLGWSLMHQISLYSLVRLGCTYEHPNFFVHTTFTFRLEMCLKNDLCHSNTTNVSCVNLLKLMPQESFCIRWEPIHILEFQQCPSIFPTLGRLMQSLRAVSTASCNWGTSPLCLQHLGPCYWS